MADPETRGKIERVVPVHRSTVWVKKLLGRNGDYFFASALPMSVYEINKAGDAPSENQLRFTWDKKEHHRSSIMRGAGYLNHRASIYRSKWDELPRATRKRIIATYTKKES